MGRGAWEGTVHVVTESDMTTHARTVLHEHVFYCLKNVLSSV